MWCVNECHVRMLACLHKCMSDRKVAIGAALTIAGVCVMYACVYACVHACVHACARMHACIQVYVRACI